jgi:Holliday junction resolvase RusA-like endonuclease
MEVLLAPLARQISFEVPGEPISQGSGRPIRAGNGRLHVIADNPRLQPWRDAVTWHARQALDGRPPLEGAVAVELAFTFPRPRGHYGRRGLRPSAPASHAVRPDLDKLCRAVLDALVGAGMVRDDAQVAELHATKRYGERPGLIVVLRPLKG